MPRLLAAGECACTGVHGANRLASNSLLEGLVFSTEAGKRAAELASEGPVWFSHRTIGEKAREADAGLDVADLTRSLKHLMWKGLPD